MAPHLSTTSTLRPSKHSSSNPISPSISRTSSSSAVPRAKMDPKLSSSALKQSQPRNREHVPSHQNTQVEPVAGTPTPVRGGRRRRKPDTRSAEQRIAGDQDRNAGDVERPPGEEQAGEARLMDLLGIVSPAPASEQAKGVLRVSKEDIEGSKEAGSVKQRGSRRGRVDQAVSDPEGAGAQGVASPTPRTRTRRRGKLGPDVFVSESGGESGGDAVKTTNRRVARNRAVSTGMDDAPVPDGPVTSGTPKASIGRAKKPTSTLTASRPTDQSTAGHPQTRSHNIPHSAKLDDLYGSSGSAFDTSALSRSLPGQLFAGRSTRASMKVAANLAADSADEDVWDMPVTGALKPEAQNWQQQLLSGSTASPSPAATGGGVGKKGEKEMPRSARQKQARGGPQAPPSSNTQSFADPALARSGRGGQRPGHSRRHSADSTSSSAAQGSGGTATPSMGIPPPGRGAQPAGSSVSGFNVPLPHLAGYNAARAPQTPVRTPGGSAVVSSRAELNASAPPASAQGSNIFAHRGSLDASSPGGLGALGALSVRGEFPRLNQGSKGPLGVFADHGVKYAGAGFQNSPSQFAKPDLDDF